VCVCVCVCVCIRPSHKSYIIPLQKNITDVEKITSITGYNKKLKVKTPTHSKHNVDTLSHGTSTNKPEN
jgi:hypothetical protein